MNTSGLVIAHNISDIGIIPILILIEYAKGESVFTGQFV